MPKYFAYGSNCDPAVLERKGVAFTARKRALLRGYRLLFNKKSLRKRLPDCIGFANINESPDDLVEGVLYDLPDEALAPLDVSERYPEHYTRIWVAVESEGQSLECWVYQAQPAMIAEGLVPSRSYLDHILAGREFLSQQYFDALDQSQTYVSDCACCERSGEVVFVKEDETLHSLCQSCREARLSWSDAFGRMLSVQETGSLMTELVIRGEGFESIAQLIDLAVDRGLLR